MTPGEGAKRDPRIPSVRPGCGGGPIVNRSETMGPCPPRLPGIGGLCLVRRYKNLNVNTRSKRAPILLPVPALTWFYKLNSNACLYLGARRVIKGQ